MNRNAKIRVLLVDDSPLFREFLRRGLESDAAIEVAALAADPFEARDAILRVRPDAMVCDVQMPRMDGIEFIRRLLPQYSMPVIVVSSLPEAVLDALNAGAIDFVVKPDPGSPGSRTRFLEQLIVKVKNAPAARVLLPQGPEKRTAAVRPASAPLAAPGTGISAEAGERLIAIGASTGGTEAIAALLKGLPPSLPGIVVVQHFPPNFSAMYAERLDRLLPWKVKEAAGGEAIVPGTVLIAPAERHLAVRKLGGGFRTELIQGERTSGHCPSVDRLFDSVARAAGERAVGILLTGMGYDGAKGLLAMRRRGARTIGQDEASSVVYGMPKAAYELGAVEKQGSPATIPGLLLSLLGRP
ncbi:chemotaxis-specific protein-glutamate methyltransferase CheB [Paenibacillus glufosinatiresistens]|uniref:chemotaxis-specific protein-glutamate methyltransferase CheB n=1 Tax=Paenibacillus glufosinatiresistens TaxID=3070657 RepID=UPI00286E70F4|nr:chemotaxis-specific protein-glutamate methyltransferase CheB [Paenibacillus sp. YX.27]